MRPWIRWLLTLTVLASLVSLLWPEGQDVVAAVGDGAGPGASAPPSVPDGQPSRAALPSRLAEVVLDPALFDPFVGVEQAPVPVPAPVQAAAVQAPPVPVPVAPPLAYRYLGRMVDPAGRPHVYLTRDSGAEGSAVVAVAAGSRLDDGYVVESINADNVTLKFPSPETLVVIDIPPASEPAPR